MALLGQDAKKIVALSTLSQLGLIVYSLATCSELLTLNHLLIHAYFKSLLFMCVGTLIHRSFGTQESRIGADGSSPRGSVLLGATSVLSIRGMVATSGAGSKHLLLEGIGRVGGLTTLRLFVLGSSFTILYRGKLLRVLSRARSGLASSSCRGVNLKGLFPLIVRSIGGMSYLWWSPLCSGLLYSHHPSSSFFLVLVSILFWVGFVLGPKMNRGVWPRLANRAGSVSALGAPLSSHVSGDKPISLSFSNWYRQSRHLLAASLLVPFIF